MPFMFGPSPIRRTIPYLSAGKLLFRERVKIMEIHYNMFWKHWRKDNSHRPHDSHIGLREFYFWSVPQIQYKNPNVQIVRFLEQTPNPFIRCWLDNGKDVLFDCDSKSRHEILSQLIKILGKSEKMLELEAKLNVSQQSVENPAIFGFMRKRWCMCEIEGQLPCPGVVQLPKNLRGKYIYVLKDDLEKEEQDMIAGNVVPNYEPPPGSSIKR